MMEMFAYVKSTEALFF